LTADQWQALYPRAVLDVVQKEPGLIESIKPVHDRFGGGACPFVFLRVMRHFPKNVKII
jgi:hypothetical protein